VQLCKCEIEIATKLFKNKFIIYYIIYNKLIFEQFCGYFNFAFAQLHNCTKYNLSVSAGLMLEKCQINLVFRSLNRTFAAW
jgi:hypothetical protein